MYDTVGPRVPDMVLVEVAVVVDDQLYIQARQVDTEEKVPQYIVAQDMHMDASGMLTLPIFAYFFYHEDKKMMQTPTLESECTRQSIQALRKALKQHAAGKTKKDFEKTLGFKVPKITYKGAWNTGSGADSYLSILINYICQEGHLETVYKALGTPVPNVQERLKRAVRGGPATISSYEALVLRLVPISRASLPDLKRFLREFGDQEPIEDMTKVDIQHRVFDIQQLQTAEELEAIALHISGDTGEIRPDIQAAVRQTVVDNKARVKRLQQQADGIYDRLKELERRADMKEIDKKKIRKCLSVYRNARRKSKLWKVAKIGGTALGAAAAVGLVSEVIDRNRKDDQRSIIQFIQAAHNTGNQYTLQPSEKPKGPFDCVERPDDMVKALLYFLEVKDFKTVTDATAAATTIINLRGGEKHKENEETKEKKELAKEWIEALDKCKRAFLSGKITLPGKA